MTQSNKGRRNHRWIPGVEACFNCGLVERHTDVWLDDGSPGSLIQWLTPAGAVLAARPTLYVRGTVDASSPQLRDVLPAGVPISGVPQCPKTPDAWAVTVGRPAKARRAAG